MIREGGAPVSKSIEIVGYQRLHSSFGGLKCWSKRRVHCWLSSLKVSPNSSIFWLLVLEIGTRDSDNIFFILKAKIQMISITVIILKRQGYLHYQSKWNSGENHNLNQDSGILNSVWPLTFKFKNGEKTTLKHWEWPEVEFIETKIFHCPWNILTRLLTIPVL